jgi:hypothetical protein
VIEKLSSPAGFARPINQNASSSPTRSNEGAKSVNVADLIKEKGRLGLGQRSCRETHFRVSVWLAILTAALALLVGGIKGSAGIRRQWRTLTAPVHMNDPSQGVIATAK